MVRTSAIAPWVALIFVLLPGLAAAEAVRVRVGGRVEPVQLERYVASAVASELYPDWPLEALKAQAVVARSYALHERARRRDEPYDLDSSVLSQRYGVSAPSESVMSAVELTRGEHLTYEGEPILAAFHAAAGGRTASAEEVWGREVPYLRSVVSLDDDAPDHFWSWEITRADLVAALLEGGLAVSEATLGALGRSPSGRVASLEVGGRVVSGRDLRRILGGRALRSTLFEVREAGDRIRFVGSGAGHGVGLSQWGARELALRQRDYRAILSHYYPGTTLRALGAAGGASE